MLLAGAPAGTGPALAYGANELAWPDAPHKDLLGALARPALIMTQDLHTALLNQAALERIGLGDDPTGLLRERACFAAVAHFTGEIGRRGRSSGWAEAMREAAQRGVVGVTRLRDDRQRDRLAAAGADRRTARARRAARSRSTCSTRRSRAGLRTGATLSDARLHRGPGEGVRRRFARQPDGVVRGQLSRGRVGFRPARARAGRARRRLRRGERPRARAGRARHRRPREHDRAGCVRAGRCRRTHRARPAAQPARPGPLRRLGVVAGVQPAHLHDDRDTADVLWAGRTDRAYAYRSLHEAGAQVEFGSDAPVSPLDPWRAIAAAVTRADSGRDAGMPSSAWRSASPSTAARGGRATPQVGDIADLALVPASTRRRGRGADRRLATLLAGALDARGRSAFRRSRANDPSNSGHRIDRTWRARVTGRPPACRRL